jgi:hypothetical protein
VAPRVQRTAARLFMCRANQESFFSRLKNDARHLCAPLLHATSCSHHIPNNRDYKQKLSIKSTKKHFSVHLLGSIKRKSLYFLRKRL